MSKVDKERIKHAVREILEAIGEDPDREGLIDTPKRIANMYEEIFAGIGQDEGKHLEIFLKRMTTKNWFWLRIFLFIQHVNTI